MGRHLSAALCRQNMPCRVLTRKPEQHPWLKSYDNIEIIRGDLSDLWVLNNEMQGCTAVIHAGGLFRLWGDAQQFIRANVHGTENMIQAAIANGVERFIHVSTVAVIGHPASDSIIDETFPPQPADSYQRSKLKGEQLVLKYYQEQDFPALILRPGAYYGPYGEYAFNRLFFTDPMRGIIMQVNGGKHIIFPVYIADVVQAILKALDKGIPGETYHICGDWISHKDAFDIICQEANIHWPRLPIPGWAGIKMSQLLENVSRITGREPFWPINLRSYVYNNWRISSDKARNELGFEPTNFRDGARRTIAWYRARKPERITEIEC